MNEGRYKPSERGNFMAIRLNGIFRDGAVLQRGREIRIFGNASAGSRVLVRLILDSKTIKTEARRGDAISDSDGYFVAVLPELDEGGPYVLEVSCGDEKVTFSDIYVGELWIAGGQDNMEMALEKTEDYKDFVENWKDNKVHYYSVPVCGEFNEKFFEAEDNSKWIKVTKRNAGKMPGVPFYFVNELRKKVDCHVGIIVCTARGTSVASWQSVEKLKETEEGQKYLDEFRAECEGVSDEAFYEAEEEYNKECADWEKAYKKIAKARPELNDFETAKLAGEFPWPPPYGAPSYRRPGGLFETMVRRIAPVCVKGVVFYQGEEDCESHFGDYYVNFKAMIEDWRKVFDDEELFFVFAQLPMYISRDRKYLGFEDFHWPKLRRQQYLVSKRLENTAMAALTDCGEFDNIHPLNKKIPGERLGKLALKLVYEFEDVKAVPPYPIDVRRGESGLEISFAGDFNMLSMAPTEESGFEIADEKSGFRPCLATVSFDGRTVELMSPYIPFPTRCRYAYFSYGSAPLKGDDNLAVLPFERSIVKNLDEEE